MTAQAEYGVVFFSESGWWMLQLRGMLLFPLYGPVLPNGEWLSKFRPLICSYWERYDQRTRAMGTERPRTRAEKDERVAMCTMSDYWARADAEDDDDPECCECIRCCEVDYIRPMTRDEAELECP